MKEVSSVATKQSRNILQQKLTIGLDLGDHNTWNCVVQPLQNAIAGKMIFQPRSSYPPKSTAAL